MTTPNGTTNTSISPAYLDLIRELQKELDQLPNETNKHYPRPETFDVPLYIVVILAILYGSISLIAVVGNSLVICVVLKVKRMMTVTNVLIANLALADIILGMFTTPFQFHPALHQRWDFPHFMCSMAPSFKVLSVIVSVLTLTFISIDRYIAVIYPLKAGVSKSNALIVLIVIWIVGIASSIPEAHFFRVEEVPDPVFDFRRTKPFCFAHWPSDNFGRGYLTYLLCVQYVLPIVVIIFAYSRISLHMWKSTPATANAFDRENVRSRTRRKVWCSFIHTVI